MVSESTVKARERALVEMHGGFLHVCGLEICSHNDTFTKCLCCLSGLGTYLFGESDRPVEAMGSCKCWRMRYSIYEISVLKLISTRW
jgi:hypothetical protein